jgi:hypothetical protein
MTNMCFSFIQLKRLFLNKHLHSNKLVSIKPDFYTYYNIGLYGIKVMNEFYRIYFR